MGDDVAWFTRGTRANIVSPNTIRADRRAVR